MIPNDFENLSISIDTRVYTMVKTYPKTQEAMIACGFHDILKPGMLNTLGKIMTLRKGAKLKKIPFETMYEIFREYGFHLVNEKQKNTR